MSEHSIAERSWFHSRLDEFSKRLRNKMVPGRVYTLSQMYHAVNAKREWDRWWFRKAAGRMCFRGNMVYDEGLPGEPRTYTIKE